MSQVIKIVVMTTIGVVHVVRRRLLCVTHELRFFRKLLRLYRHWLSLFIFRTDFRGRVLLELRPRLAKGDSKLLGKDIVVFILW